MVNLFRGWQQRKEGESTGKEGRGRRKELEAAVDKILGEIEIQ